MGGAKRGDAARQAGDAARQAGDAARQAGDAASGVATKAGPATTEPRPPPECRPVSLERDRGGARLAAHVAEPCVLVIFGASGDLTARELIPALLELHLKRLLPKNFAVVGAARTPWDSDRFREEMHKAAERHCDGGAKGWERFARMLSYVPLDAKSPPGEDYARLGEEIERAREEHGIGNNVLYHLAVPPAFFGIIADRLGAAGMAQAEGGWRRLVIEKPFGTDRESAEELDRGLRRIFDEDQIYRIDHFLGKETVQNMLVFRFANPGFEPIWNRNYIDHVQITVAEDIGIGTRAGFYEKTGVVRDMVQNHLLQLLCMAAIEPPVNFDGSSLRDETVKVLEAVNVTPVDLEEGAVRGQYGPGTIHGEPVPGYREEEGVAPDSSTPTFVALEVTLDNWRWAGVPFYLRTGKRMARKLTEVAIHFKKTPHVMFPLPERRADRHSLLAFRLQPEEGIIRTVFAKRPGPELVLAPVTMKFLYADAFEVEEPPRAYAWLLLDAMQGDQTLFARADWIKRAWDVVDPVIARWEADPPHDFPNYRAGSWGPADAAALIERDGRSWRVI